MILDILYIYIYYVSDEDLFAWFMTAKLVNLELVT